MISQYRGRLEDQTTEEGEDKYRNTGVEVIPRVPLVTTVPKHESEVGDCSSIMGIFEEFIEAMAKIRDREERQEDQNTERRCASELQNLVE
jgi:hypothetical protein